jgi:hypothetical protein
VIQLAFALSPFSLVFGLLWLIFKPSGDKQAQSH